MGMRRGPSGVLVVVLLAVAHGRAGAQEKKPPAGQVEYGAVDAATVRVFAIGTVGTEELVLHDRRVSIAVPHAGHGSGFVIGSGMILTAHHVVDGARHIVVRLPGDGGFYAARLIHDDKDGDVAVLQVDATPPVLTLDADATLKVRQTVFAVGYPLDPTRTQAQSSRGIVSGQKDDDTLQLDMALNPGNSGGPLVDEKDRVVGMIVARGDPDKGVQGIGFAVRAERLVADVKEAKRRLDAGQIAELTDHQRQSAVVVDELVQQGVFGEIREQADLRKEIRTSDVQKALDGLASRIEDPDLLVFVGGNLWNAYVALWAADEAMLRDASLTRAKADELAKSFGQASGTACRKAFKLDPDVASRSAIVKVVLATWSEAAPVAVPVAATTTVTARRRGTRRSASASASASTRISLNLDLALRASPQVRFNPAEGSFALGGGFGAALGLRRLRFQVGSLVLLPTLGFGYGKVELFEDVAGTLRHTYLAFEIGVVTELWRCRTRSVEVAAAYAPGKYTIDAAREGHSTIQTDEWVYTHGRFAGGYRWGKVYLGSAVHVFAGPTFWFEPATLAVVF